jgi:hypothetical protein
MAEDEIVKHTRAVYKAWKNPDTSWQHKLREIVIEILIITFAISLSVWLHNFSDRLNERKEERAFLSGLRLDLQGDLENALGSKRFYDNAFRGFSYFDSVSMNEPFNQDSVNKYESVFFSTTNLDAHYSRYEALKGSGKFDIIENKDLLNKIILLHETTFKRAESLDAYYYQFSQRVVTYVQEHAELNAAGNHLDRLEPLLHVSQMRWLMVNGKSFIASNVFASYDSCIVQCRELLALINTANN